MKQDSWNFKYYGYDARGRIIKMWQKINGLPGWKDEIYKYISGIITKKNQNSIIVNGVPDHVHLIIGLKPTIAISDLVRDIKNNSSNFYK